MLRSQEAGTECRGKSAPCCWHQGARSSEKYDRKHLSSRPCTPMLNAPLEWRAGIMGSWTKDLNPKLFLRRGCPSQSTGRPGAERSQGASRPMSRTHMCCFLPVHPPSPELSSLLQRELEGRRTALDTRVRVGGTPASLQNGLLILSSQTQQLPPFQCRPPSRKIPERK